MPAAPGDAGIVAACDQQALIQDWLGALDLSVQAGQRSLETARAYRHAIRSWLTFLQERAITQPSPATVLQYLGALRTGRQPATVNLALHTIRSCYGWAEQQGRYPAIARSVSPLRVRRDGPLPILDPKTIVAAAAAALQAPPERRLSAKGIELHRLRCLRNAALIRMLYGTGVRLVSMCRANVNDVDLTGSPPSFRHQPKGSVGKDVRSILPPGVVRAITAYLEERQRLSVLGEALWVGLAHPPGTRMDVRSLRKVIIEAFEAVGVVHRDGDGHIDRPRIYSAHCLRRSATTAVVDGNGLEAGQIFAGHASSTTTRQSYARVHAYRLLTSAARHLDLPDRPYEAENLP